VNSPLASKNRFERLSVESVPDTNDTTIDSCSSDCIPNGRGSQATELGAPEACLIPIMPELDTDAQPKSGRYFIRSARVDKEIRLKIGLTTLDMHSTTSV